MGKIWFENKKVVISGASSGIGRLLAEKFITNGCTVIGIGRSQEKFQALKTALGEKANKLTVKIFDVTEKNEWQNLSAFMENEFDGADILINCAGVFPPFKKAENISSSDVERVIKTNFTSAVYAIEAFLPLLKKSKTPAIINVSSSSALASIVGTSAYTASKSALKGYTEILSEELRGSIYVGLVMPGFAQTDIFRSQNTTFKDAKLLQTFSMPADKMANKIFKGITKKKRRMVFGADAHAMSFFFKLAPVTTTKIICRVIKKTKMSLFKDLL